MSRGRVLALCLALFYVVAVLVLLTARVMGAPLPGWTIAVIPVAFAVSGAFFARWMIERSSDLLGGLLTGNLGGHHRPPPPVSRIHGLLKQERWDEARAELDREWAARPGHPKLLLAYERLFRDGLKAPEHLVPLYRRAVDAAEAADRPDVMLNLAHLLAEDPSRRDEARLWCRRVLALPPSSGRAADAGALLESLDANREPPARPRFH